MFTGVATYYGALVSRDQLEQSRDEIQREARDQASRVSYWTEFRHGTDKPVKRLHVMNRSPDPVTEVQSLLWTRPNDGRTVLELPTLAPCSETIIDVTLWTDDSDQDAGLGRIPGSRPAARFLVFRDRDGVRWKRDEAGLSRVTDRLPLTSGPDTHAVMLGTDGTQVKRAPSCGDGS